MSHGDSAAADRCTHRLQLRTSSGACVLARAPLATPTLPLPASRTRRSSLGAGARRQRAWRGSALGRCGSTASGGSAAARIVGFWRKKIVVKILHRSMILF